MALQTTNKALQAIGELMMKRQDIAKKWAAWARRKKVATRAALGGKGWMEVKEGGRESREWRLVSEMVVEEKRDSRVRDWEGRRWKSWWRRKEWPRIHASGWRRREWL
ncbi:unnamed protein product [Fraxinus pennsylvanica]|uniref:Uncharacterized protein n=1 Tax=Fraxinus pennsylvanica TaxID=56036 RepID=A0AAD1YU83_9LAMI|nr:unnamed protein product [Fraxinus pennsylvanica]